MKKASGARRDRRDSEYEGDGISSASRILWALAGVVAYVVAKYFFGF